MAFLDRWTGSGELWAWAVIADKMMSTIETVSPKRVQKGMIHARWTRHKQAH